MNVTFDTNCIIALEKNEEDAPHLRRLVEAAQVRGLKLHVVGISASERQQKGKRATFPDFEDRLTKIGLEGAEILLPTAVWGMTFWNKSKWGSRHRKEEAKRIHAILFPNSSFEYGEYCRRNHIDPEARPLDKHWRNCRIDTEALWAHIHNGGGVFVTSDGNFNKPPKKARLAELGAGEIMRPEEAAARLCSV